MTSLQLNDKEAYFIPICTNDKTNESKLAHMETLSSNHILIIQAQNYAMS